MKGLTETVARALCYKDLTEPIKELSDEESEALDYAVDYIFNNFLNLGFSKENFKILSALASRETRQPSRIICKQFELNLTENHWKEYKPFAITAIEAYDKWLEEKKNTDSK